MKQSIAQQSKFQNCANQFTHDHLTSCTYCTSTSRQTQRIRIRCVIIYPYTKSTPHKVKIKYFYRNSPCLLCQSTLLLQESVTYSNRPLALRGHVTNASFKQCVGIFMLPKIDRAQKLSYIFCGDLIFQRSSMICIGRHAGQTWRPKLLFANILLNF